MRTSLRNGAFLVALGAWGTVALGAGTPDRSIHRKRGRIDTRRRPR
jgi:hypothetical protein